MLPLLPLLLLLLLLLLPLLLLPCSAAVLFTPDANCSRVYGSSDRDIWWECSRSLRQKLYPPPSAHQQAAGPGHVGITLDPSFQYQLGDVPLVGRVLDGGGAVIRPTPGASCVVYLVGGQGGGVRSSFSHATLSGSVLTQLAAAADAPAVSNAVSVRGSVPVASGSWVFIKTTGAGAAPAPVITWHATRVLTSTVVAAENTTALFLLDALPASVRASASVFLSTKQVGRNVGGAGLVRVEGGVLGHRSTAYNRTGEPLVTTWGRTQQFTLRDLTFEGALCAIQLDTHVIRSFDDTAKGPPQFVYESGVIETGTVSNIVLRGGAVLAAIIDSGGTNGVMWSSVHIWPFSYPGEPSSYCNVLKDNRGYPFFLPETGQFWSGVRDDAFSIYLNACACQA